MGKKPGKWIKSLLSGKKSSKSNLSKKSDFSDVSLSGPTVNSSLISAPISGASLTKEALLDIVSGSSNDNVILSAEHEEANVQAVVNFCSLDDIKKMKLTEAAIKAQAALRGYLARREFQMLKAITRLQSLIRAHLLRRQAVSMLYCVRGIVKFQALARGYKVRCSEIGLAVHTICKGMKYSNSIRVVAPTQVELSESVFVRKLLASLSSSVPLHLNYDPGEPNLAWKWLDCWTRSHFWAPLPEAKKKFDLVSNEKKSSCQTVEKDECQAKRNARKVSKVKVGDGSFSDSNKDKRRPEKVSSHTLQPAQENSQKVSSGNVSDRSEISSEKRKHITRNVSGHTITDVAEHDPSASAEKMKDMAGSKSKKSGIEKSLGKQAENEDDKELHDNPMANLQTDLNNGSSEGTKRISGDFNSGNNCVSDVKTKSSLRRASLPGKFDDLDIGVHNSPRLPSYMAPTESAKAKLRAQGSPRCASDLIEKIRRHSLSSSTNGKLGSFSPRAERLVAMSSRVIRTDRSLSSSRDGTDKIIQPQWRR